MWPPILPRFNPGGGGGAGGVSGYNYGDMEQWLPGRIPEDGTGRKKAQAKPKPNNPEFEIYEDDGERVKVEYFVYEKSFKDRLKRFFFKNKKSSLFVILLLITCKLVSCILYVWRLCMDDPLNANCYNCYDNTSHYEVIQVRWNAIVWVHRPLWMWATQTGIALFTLSMTLIMTILRYKGNVWELLTGSLFMECLTTIPFIITLCAVFLRNLFIPAFLNIWLAAKHLSGLFNSGKLGKGQSILAQQVVAVLSTLICLIFTAMCCFEHAQRGSAAEDKHFNFFQAFYFIMVTLSTVGYGDISPDIWLSQILVVLVIFTALGILPKQFEMLAATWMERQRLGGSYTKSTRRGADKHVVLCLPSLDPETLMDFLSEFFAYRRLQDHTVVIMTQDDLQPHTKQVLQMNQWANKVRYIKGSCLRDGDLVRVRIMDADGCFILSVDSPFPKGVADEQTIVYAWAIKDFAPSVPQFVQIFRPENKVHVDFADSIICEDEFKYAMLAYNCLCPGASTLITLLLHTSRGEEGNQCDEDWIRMYGKCSGNEIYKTQVSDSIIFKEYLGKNFPYTSLHAHRKYGVTLIAVKSVHDPEDEYVKLNPGPTHIMRETDLLYYLSVTREQNMNFTREKINPAGIPLSALGKRKVGPSETSPGVTESDEGVPKEIVVKGPQNGLSKDVAKLINNTGQAFRTVEDDDELSGDATWISDLEKNELRTAFPPVTPYVGTSPTVCHLLKKQKKDCCMRLDMECDHCPYQNAKQYNWQNRSVILIAVKDNNGIYNFILPLRASVLARGTLKPVILMFEEDPDPAFIDSLSWFPMIYWMKGNINKLDDLLTAGIDLAEDVVVTNRENSFNDDDEMGDCATIVIVQTLLKFFPNLNIITELSSTTMMRFLHFEAGNPFAQYMSFVEKQEKEKGSHVSFMFRLQFASGNVFSAKMIHTLLYQAILKDFVITLTRLMLGIDQTPGSGFLTSIDVRPSDLRERGTYGKMFSHLCAKSGSVPIAVYRTHRAGNDGKFKPPSKNPKELRRQTIEKKETIDLIKSRLESLEMNKDEYGITNAKGRRGTSGSEYQKDTENKVMYVLINPHVDMALEPGDLVYFLKPNPASVSRENVDDNNLRRTSEEIVGYLESVVPS